MSKTLRTAAIGVIAVATVAYMLARRNDVSVPQTQTQPERTEFAKFSGHGVRFEHPLDWTPGPARRAKNALNPNEPVDGMLFSLSGPAQAGTAPAHLIFSVVTHDTLPDLDKYEEGHFQGYQLVWGLRRTGVKSAVLPDGTPGIYVTSVDEDGSRNVDYVMFVAGRKSVVVTLVADARNYAQSQHAFGRVTRSLEVFPPDEKQDGKTQQ